MGMCQQVDVVDKTVTIPGHTKSRLSHDGDHLWPYFSACCGKLIASP